MKKRSEGQRGDLNGFLDAGSFIKGELHFEDTFRLDGKLEGAVESHGDLVVGENGQVEAKVSVGRIYVSGTVRGSIVARRRVEIASGAKVYADLETPSLVVEDGAVLQGRCNMGGQGGRGGRDGSAESGRREATAKRAVVTPMPLPKEG